MTKPLILVLQFIAVIFIFSGIDGNYSRMIIGIGLMVIAGVALRRRLKDK